MGLDLYAKIEADLDFEQNVKYLHSEFLRLVFENDCDNILDIGCGQGAFMIHLLANGKNVEGIDLSNEQIKVCQQFGLNASAKDLKDVNATFDCATAIFDVINYIPKTEVKLFFENTYKVLNKGAYFFFDVNSYFGFDEVAQGSLNINLDDRFIAIDALFENNKLQTDITLFSKTNNNYIKEEDSITQYYHETKFLKEELKKSGFSIKEVLNFNLHSEDEADKLIFICQK